MEKIEKGEMPFSNFGHVGIVVRDMEAAVKYYQSLGIGPFVPVTTAVAEKEFRGKPMDDVRLDLRVGQMGQIKIELIQPIAGESLHSEFLETKGEGVNHLCFSVDDIEKETAKLVKKGVRIISSRRFVNGGGNVYFDTGKVGGILIELLQQPPE